MQTFYVLGLLLVAYNADAWKPPLSQSLVNFSGLCNSQVTCSDNVGTRRKPCVSCAVIMASETYPVIEKYTLNINVGAFIDTT